MCVCTYLYANVLYLSYLALPESPQLLVSNATKIISILTDTNANVQGSPNFLPFGRLNRMVALDYVNKGGRHYVAYTDGSTVKRRAMDGSQDITIANGLRDPRGIAIDCVTGNIYYLDVQKPMIAVSNIEGTSQRVCLEAPQVSKPYSLVLNTRKG